MRQKIILALYILLFWILLPGIILGSALVFDQVFIFGPRRSLVAGILILCMALPMLIVSILQFKRFSGKYPVSADPPRTFICDGFYAVWRHPIYLFYTLMLLGAALIWGSQGMIFLSLPCFILLEGVYIFVEERILVRRFGDSYIHYRKRTPLLIPRFYYWLKIPVFFLAKCKYRIRVSGREHIPASPPFFLVASHRNYLDPLLLGLILPFPIRFVTTFEMYRTAKTRWFFKSLDCIPKKRYLHDVSTGREIVRAVRQNDVIGIFPEGERAWTGSMNPLKPETLHLFQKYRQLNILPVKLKGNFYGWPRWGKGIRSSNVHINFQQPIQLNESWDRKEIERRIKQAIDPGDLKDSSYFCRSKKRMEYLDKVLYRCPICRSFESLVLQPTEGYCSTCKARLHLDANYHPRFTLKDHKVEGRLDEIYQNIRIGAEDLESSPFIAESKEVQLYQESSSGMQRVSSGKLYLSRDQLTFTAEAGNTVIDLAEVSSVTTESNFKLQIYNKKTSKLYQLVFAKESVLKWQDLMAQTIHTYYGKVPNLR